MQFGNRLWCLLIFVALFGCVGKKSPHPTVDPAAGEHALQMDMNTVRLIPAPKTVRFYGEKSTLVAGGNARVSIIDFETAGAMEFPFQNSAYAYSDKTNTLALGVEGGVALYDTKTGKLREAFKGNKIARKMVYSPDGVFLAVATATRVLLVDVANGKTVASFLGGGWEYGQFDFSSDGRFFAVGCNEKRPSRKGIVHLYDLLKKEIVHKFPIEGTINELRFSPDSKKLVTSTTDPGSTAWHTGVHVFTLDSGQRALYWESEEGVIDVLFSPDSKTMVLATLEGALILDGVVRVFDLEKDDKASRLSLDEKVIDIDISPDGKLVSIVTGSYSMWGKYATLSVYDVSVRKVVYSSHFDEFFNQCSFSADGRFIVTGGEGATVRMFSRDALNMVAPGSQ